MKADLTSIAGDWAVLCAQTGVTRWFWVDTDTQVTPKGVHLVDELPESEPAQVTHVWGWGSGRWVRARVDREPGAPCAVLRGALLVEAVAGKLDVVTSLAQVWPATEGRVGMGSHPVLHRSVGVAATANVHTVTVSGSESDGTVVLNSLTFFELVGER